MLELTCGWPFFVAMVCESQAKSEIVQIIGSRARAGSLLVLYGGALK